MNTNRSAFFIALMQELMTSMNNWYGAENWDTERYGPYKSSFKREAVTKLNKLFKGKAAIVPTNVNRMLIQKLSSIENHLEGLASLYELLADEPSRSTLVKVLAYRLTGYKNVKLPLNTSSYWSIRKGMQSWIKSPDTIKIKFPKVKLIHLTLETIGYPIEMYYAPSGVMATFVLKQYEYRKRKPEIKAQDGDYVIDAGGCWGDTALYFAETVGERGRVYTFEFTPENLEVFRRNMDLNSQLSQRIDLVEKALWGNSGELIDYSPIGPATSMIQSQQCGGNQDSLQVTTISIDDFVTERKLPRVDFIKMDIEGAELNALKGAEQSIRAFKPRLAISLYHRQEDFVTIPTYLRNLNLGYEFFLDHFTIYSDETILFATPKVA